MSGGAGELMEVKVLEAHALHVFRTSLGAIAGMLEDSLVQELMLKRADEDWVERGDLMQRMGLQDRRHPLYLRSRSARVRQLHG